MIYLLILFLQVAASFAASPFAGVNIAGFDFGSDIQGKHNLSSAFGPVVAIGNGNSDGAAQIQHFVQQGLNTFRLPTTWQFMINSNNLNGSAVNVSAGALATSDGQLDRNNTAQYNELVQGCLATGSNCIIDIHNYARFEGQVIGQGGPTNEQFASLWSQIASMYQNETRVIFGVMNEPHDIPDLSMWADTVQAAVTAIRMAGATQQMILLPGTDFTGAQTFVTNGSAGNLSRVHNLDGSNTSLIFDVHKYLDSDGSGTHLECVSDHVQDTFTPLAQFLVANGRKAILSETGGGNTTSCITDLCNELAFINMNTEAYIGYTAWSAGGFSPLDYNLTLTPKGFAGSFTDQEIASRCVIGTRNGSNGTATNVTKATGPSQSPQPQPALPQVVLAAGAQNMIEGGWIGSILALAALTLW
ncbi:putative glycoside hydrolase family 5 protein [Diaporthe ampelina]|uniref:Endoglucanase EG-II n=1 Tax=Diaporthe ampelina TaxID=1214573 RepID=A0A0G2I682_9PEZI|nr:putative glycoside hydrolase family 5 protein [Diaporthe ampelina]